MTFNAPVGERFTQVYGRDSIPRGDSREMRVRLGSLMVTHFRAGGGMTARHGASTTTRTISQIIWIGEAAF